VPLKFEHVRESTIRTVVTAGDVKDALHEIGVNGCRCIDKFARLARDAPVALDLDINSDYWIMRVPDGGGDYGYLAADNVEYIAEQAWKRGE